MVLVGRKSERTVARGYQQAEQGKGEEGQSGVTVERGEQSKFEPEEDCGGERQAGRAT